MNMNFCIHRDIEIYRFSAQLHNSKRFSQSKILCVSLSVFVFVSIQEGADKGSTLSVLLKKSPSCF